MPHANQPVRLEDPEWYDDDDSYPDEWIDEVEVDRHMAGDQSLSLYRGHSLTGEVVEAIRRLAALGMSDRQISQRMHGRLSPGAVHKARHRNGIPAGVPLGQNQHGQPRGVRAMARGRRRTA